MVERFVSNVFLYVGLLVLFTFARIFVCFFSLGDAGSTVRDARGFPFSKTDEDMKNTSVLCPYACFVHIRARICSLCTRNVSARFLHFCIVYYCVL